MATRYRDAKTGKFLSQKTVDNYKPINKVTSPQIIKEGKTYRPETKREIEDRIMDQFKENEFLLFPENAANMDKKSLKAVESSYEFDMAKNPEIFKDVTFDEYLNSVSPELLRQRSKSNIGLDNDYLGPVSDVNNGVSQTAEPLSNAGKQFNHSYTKMIESAKRAYNTLNNLENNIENTLQKTNDDFRSQMFGNDPTTNERDPRI